MFFSTSAFAYDLKEYYPLHAGDQWTYSETGEEGSRNTTYSVDGRELIGGVETTRIQLGREEYEWVGIDEKGIKIYKTFDGEAYTTVTPLVFIPNNMEIGKTEVYTPEDTSYDVHGIKVGSNQTSRQLTLKEIASLTVRAGEFTDCLKFLEVVEDKDEEGNNTKNECVIWFAPGVGKIKESCVMTKYDPETDSEKTSHDETELISAVIDGKVIGSQNP